MQTRSWRPTTRRWSRKSSSTYPTRSARVRSNYRFAKGPDDPDSSGFYVPRKLMKRANLLSTGTCQPGEVRITQHTTSQQPQMHQQLESQPQTIVLVQPGEPSHTAQAKLDPSPQPIIQVSVEVRVAVPTPNLQQHEQEVVSKSQPAITQVDASQLYMIYLMGVVGFVCFMLTRAGLRGFVDITVFSHDISLCLFAMVCLHIVIRTWYQNHSLVIKGALQSEQNHSEVQRLQDEWMKMRTERKHVLLQKE